jgi:hypothetical protein
VRALKLRRLGNLTMALQRLAAGGEDGPDERERFASLLIDLYLTRRVVGANLAGQISLDPGVAEDLVGKTWRASELESVTNLDLIPLAEARTDDGEFRVETTYLGDQGSGEIYVDRQIRPLALRAGTREARRNRLLVEEAGLYPGLPPRRLKLIRGRRAPLTLGDVARFGSHAIADLPELRRRLADRLAVPTGAPEAVVAFRPAALVTARTEPDRVGARDGEGRTLAVDVPAGWVSELPRLLPDPGRYFLVGHLYLGHDGPTLRCLSVVGELRWGRGPIYPDSR